MKPISKEEYIVILERQQNSGLSIKYFCANESYTVSSFHYWKSKYDTMRYFLCPGKTDMRKGNLE